jgi:hypothetical protein
MAQADASPIPSVALDSIRAAIEVVHRRVARRVVIHVIGAERLLPAVRALARNAGVEARPAWSADLLECDIVIAEHRVADE